MIKMNSPTFSSESAAATRSTPASMPNRRRRINPWRMFIGSMVPNWLQSRTEVSQGAKLAYGRLAQYAGKNGACYPKQKTLAVELGVTERTANEYIRELVEFGLVDKVRPGLGRPNQYFFLDHHWFREGQHPSYGTPGLDRATFSGLERKDTSGAVQKDTSLPNNDENHPKETQEKRIHSLVPSKALLDLGDSARAFAKATEIYESYPRKAAKPAGMAAIVRAMVKHDADFLLERTQLFARTCNIPLEYIPYPATWFGREQFNDDPSTWRRTESTRSKPAAIIRPDAFSSGVSKL
jgi:hypothetical protein